MYTARHLSARFILRFAWKPLLIFGTYGAAITILYELCGWTFLALPFTPIGLLGTAVAFYVGFKNNSSYERLWEARKLWGTLVNASRTLGVYVLDYIQPSSSLDISEMREHRRIILYRHVAYVNALRIQLRQRTTWESKDDPFTRVVEEETPFSHQDLLAEIGAFLHEDEARDLYGKTDTATHLLRKQQGHFQYLASQGCLDSFKQVELGRVIVTLYDQQGGCERIKNFPFPRQYAYFSELFVWILALVLPYGLVGELSKYGAAYVWVTIPMSMLISWIFNVMEIVGDKSENPFEKGINDVPMTAICRTIEIDLREMLGETNLPAKIKSVNNILM